MVKITKKMLANRKVILGEQYISNGHWAANKGMIENAETQFKNEDTIKAAFPKVIFIDHKKPNVFEPLVLPDKTLTAYHKTNFINDNEYQARAFMADDGDLLYLNEDYIPLLNGADTVYSTDNTSPVFNAKIQEEVTVVIMPIKVEEKIILKWR